MENLPRVDDLIKDQNPHSTAVIHNNKRYTYEDLQKGMHIVAKNLQFHQVYTDKIIVLLGNTPEAIMAIMGISYIGGTFIPVPATIKADRLTEIIKDSGATTIITDEKYFNIVDTLGETETLRAVIEFNKMLPFPDIDKLCQSKPAYPAALMYTSGTTGKPKGVICPHHKIMAAVSSINAYMMHTKKDIVASALPLSHGYGLYQAFTVFEAGGTVLLEDSFAYPVRTLDRIVKHKATGFAAVPSMMHMIMKLDNWQDYLNNLSYITTAGAALPSSTFEILLDELKTVDIIPMYGQTECVRALYYPISLQVKHNVQLQSCGILIPDTQTFINDGRFYATSEAEGELIIKSPHVMDGYWNNPEETKKVFKDGKLYTGDIFGIDENGFHYYIGRTDDIVKVKGERCSPVEIDDKVMKMPDIIEAAAFAMEDPLWGNRFILYVSTDSATLSRADIMRFCKQNLEQFLIPRDVVILGKLPKNDNGKLSRALLKEHYENRGKTE